MDGCRCVKLLDIRVEKQIERNEFFNHSTSLLCANVSWTSRDAFLVEADGCEHSHGTSEAAWKWLRWSAWWTFKVCRRDTGLQGRERAARIAKGAAAAETAGLSAADTPNQVQASHCSACVRVLSAPEASNNRRAGRKCSRREQLAAAHEQADRQAAQFAPCWRQRGQAKAAKAKGKGQKHSWVWRIQRGPAGCEAPESPLARDPAFGALVLLWARTGGCMYKGGVRAIMQYQTTSSRDMLA